MGHLYFLCWESSSPQSLPDPTRLQTWCLVVEREPKTWVSHAQLNKASVGVSLWRVNQQVFCNIKCTALDLAVPLPHFYSGMVTTLHASQMSLFYTRNLVSQSLSINQNYWYHSWTCKHKRKHVHLQKCSILCIIEVEMRKYLCAPWGPLPPDSGWALFWDTTLYYFSPAFTPFLSLI